MKRPSFQFYPGDWTSDLKLRRCSPAARGVWLDVLCAFHDSDDGYGLLRWPLKDIANTIGADMKLLRELADKGVLRGSDKQLAEQLVYVPRSGRKEGTPVVLIDSDQPGPLWYSKRMVVDEHVRTIRGESSRFGAEDGAAPKPAKKPAPKPPLGDGTSTPSPSSTSSPSGKEYQGAIAPSSPAPPPTTEPPSLDGIEPAIPPCPIKTLVGHFINECQTLPKPRLELFAESQGAEAMRQRWKWLFTASRDDDTRYATTRDEGVDWFKRFFETVDLSDFLSGRAGKWKADLAWLMKRENFMKVVQGNYANRPGKPQHAQPGEDDAA